MVAKLKELDGAIVKKLLSESVGSLLVLLPDSFNGGMDDESKEKLRDIEVAVFGAFMSVGMSVNVYKIVSKAYRGLNGILTRVILSFIHIQ